MRLTAKLSVILSLLASMLLGSTLGFLYVAERRHLMEQARSTQVASVEKLARVCSDSMLEGNELIRLMYLKTFWSSFEPGLIDYVALLDSGGRVLMHSNFLRGDFTLQNSTATDPILLRTMQAQGLLSQEAGGRWVLSVPLMAKGKRLGTIVAAYGLGALDLSVQRVQRETIRRFTQASLVGLLLSLLSAFLLARALTRPLRELTLGARKIGQGDLQCRIQVRSRDELGDLAQEFNSMGEKLTELDELKDSFLAQVTHDLRNPLGAILGYAEIMHLGMQGPITPKQNESLRIICTNVNFLSELINNILDLTKIEAGRMEFIRKPMSLRRCADSVIELLAVKAAEFKIALDGSGIPEDVTVMADEAGIRRVLTNLTANALKFTPGGGRVSLGHRRQADGADCVFVQDTGIGIPENKLHTLFKKFSQIHETRDKVRESKGTGLGLVIAKEIVEGHGGRIWVESKYQHGTTFLFTLPAATTQALYEEVAIDAGGR